jgi:hypothetical protein
MSDDVMKLRVMKDLRVLRLCNPPTCVQSFSDLWPAISMRSQPSVHCYLMSIPIESAHPLNNFSFAKIQKNIDTTKYLM